MNRAFERIEKICEGELVDTVTGPMTPSVASKELARVFCNRTPEDVILVMKRTNVGEKPLYQTSIYMSREDSRKYGGGE
jgi:hypothetical protein